MTAKLIAVTDPATGLPIGTTAVFLTLGSALVALFQASEPAPAGGSGFRWICLGCLDHSTYPDPRQTARNNANTHAAECRAIPLPTAA
ncbi:hypothetical protein [Kitasatospora sp. NPDC088134]|uniref:hypothetical protein n=1 Tax=Kitasatospora sp. NPDC088134 TaxID=3364071 RepID=UPI0037F85313